MKLAIAMSGGVDSSVAAKILSDEGHQVCGLFLKLWSDPTCKIEKENRCCDYEALEDARKVAAKLNIPFYVINARDEFKKEVVNYFLDRYKNLQTPNPCIVCNDKIKFGLLLKRALEIGCKKLATGHYARIKDAGNPKSETRNPKKLEARSYKLKAGIDKSKDQSYMLYHLTQNQLSRVLFPLGEITKSQVRKLAVEWDLPVKEKPESQEICFFGDKDYRTFSRRHLEKKYFLPGDIVDSNGNVIGRHDGLINYTVGQRKGISQELKNPRTKEPKNHYQCHSELISESQRSRNEFGMTDKNKEPLYVVGFDVKKNQLIVGADKEIYQKEMMVGDLNWVDRLKNARTKGLKNIKVKIRYRHEAVPCEILNYRSKNCHCEESATRQSDSNLLVVFDQPQRAITPGQSAVFYVGDEVVGGGIIEN